MQYCIISNVNYNVIVNPKFGIALIVNSQKENVMFIQNIHNDNYIIIIQHLCILKLVMKYPVCLRYNLK